MIYLSHIYKTYPGPTHALKNIDLSIEKGEFVFLTGQSGAGKTTLFQLISAFDRPTSGKICVAGYDYDRTSASEIPYLRRKIGVVYQDFRLLKDRSIYDNVKLPLEVRGDSSSYIDARVREILGDVGLLFKKDKFPSQLSGGEQQRVAIARALAPQPGILIADEPTGNLDPELSKDIMSLLNKVNAQGTTIFVATHDMSLVEHYKKRVVHLKQGEVSA